jgi:hypothetical protein
MVTFRSTVLWRMLSRVLLVALFLPCSQALGQTLYVGTTNACSCPADPTDLQCGQQSKPFSCISDAVLRDFTTIIVGNGTYKEIVNIIHEHGGTSEATRKTIRSENLHGATITSPSTTNSATVKVSANYVTVSGFRITGGFRGLEIEGADIGHTDQGTGVVAENLEITGNGGGAILERNCSSVRITGCDIHHNDLTDGVKLDGDHCANNPCQTPIIHDTIIENSHIHHNHSNGVLEGNAERTIIRNSEVDNNGHGGYAHGFYMKGFEGLIQNNKVHHNSGYGLHFWAAPRGSASRHYIAERNDIFSNGSGVVVAGTDVEKMPPGDGYPHYVEVRYNLIHHNQDTGFIYYVDKCAGLPVTANDNSFHHNTVYDNRFTALALARLKNDATTRLLLKDNIFVGLAGTVTLVFLTNTSLSADDLDGNIYYVPGVNSSTTPGVFWWRCEGCQTNPNAPGYPNIDTRYSFDQIRNPGISQDNTPSPSLSCGNATTVAMDERSRWIDPLVVDHSTSTWPNPIGLTRGDFHLRRNSPAASGGVCCSISNGGNDIDNESLAFCFPTACNVTNSGVGVGADFYLDSSHDGVADRNECNPADGTVCDCNTQFATDCVAESPEIAESQEISCVVQGYPGAPYDSAVAPSPVAEVACDGKDTDCNPQTTAGGGEADLDHDGYYASCGLDCNDSDPWVYPGRSEGPFDLGTCFDGIDNDCDGLVDLDCAIDISPDGQFDVYDGQFTCGSQGDLAAASLDNTYECAREVLVSGKYQSSIVYTFSTSGVRSGTNYDLKVDGYRNAGANDQFNFSASKRATPGLCSGSEGGSTTLVGVGEGPPDPNTLKTADVGLSQDTFCVKMKDSKVNGDTGQQDTLTLDRLYLFPTPVAFADYPVSGDVGIVSNGNADLTHRSDDTADALTENVAAGAYRLWHTFQFKGVPSGSSHKLHFEGFRAAPQNPPPGFTLDDFKFYYSTDPPTSSSNPLTGFTLISGATINTTTDVSGGTDSSSFGPPTLSGTIYIRVIDAQNSGSASWQNTVWIDHLTIKTVP